MVVGWMVDVVDDGTGWVVVVGLAGVAGSLCATVVDTTPSDEHPDRTRTAQASAVRLNFMMQRRYGKEESSPTPGGECAASR